MWLLPSPEGAFILRETAAENDMRGHLRHAVAALSVCTLIYVVSTDVWFARQPPPVRSERPRPPLVPLQPPLMCPPQKAGARIAIVSVSTPDRVAMYQPATNSKQCYALRHGYTFVMDTNDATTSLNPWWRKPTAIRKYLESGLYDWILFMDADTVITNHTVKLEWFLPAAPNANTSLVLTDHNVALNNGVFFIRNGEWSLRFLDDWIEVGEMVHNRSQRWAWDDQGGMYEMLLRDAQVDYDGECSTPDACCEYGALQRCYNRRMEAAGHAYGSRRLPHVRFIDPRFHAVGESSWIRGGFDQYSRDQFNGQTWIYGEWSEENFWRPGDFVLHVYDKSKLEQLVPKEWADAC